MVLDKDYQKRKYGVKKVATPIPRLVSLASLPTPSGLDSGTYSASANIETVSSLTPENTLSMVSTPWTTESWNSEESLEQSFMSWMSTEELPESSLTLEPASSTSYGASTSYHSNSRRTLTLLSGVITPSESRQMVLLNKNGEYSDTVSTWTMETYTSTGLLTDSNILRVAYPWSPCSGLSGSELYPSSLESYESRKVSRVSVSGTPDRDPMIPMNYNFVRQDKDPIVEWLLVKLKGLDVVDVRV